ncbi:probable ATP-dependent RNA helicase DDX43, partial [Carlito syrichta]|uniref:Probable ATP-dependent RNA helicase DDX43 n=1 Tax=Carlito syrichta TaxID=1868482 RepID=A0A3Q0DLT9_CARSF
IIKGHPLTLVKIFGNKAVPTNAKAVIDNFVKKQEDDNSECGIGQSADDIIVAGDRTLIDWDQIREEGSKWQKKKWAGRKILI